MRIGLITTLNTNIGDDFIREGISLILREVFKGNNLEFVPVNKHQPLTVYPVWHPIHLEKFTHFLPKGRARANRFIKRSASKLTRNRFTACDLVIQCGTPVLWPGCHQAEWAEPLWHNVIAPLSKRIPVLNIAAGSCYPWEKQPTQITDPHDKRYLEAMLGYCHLITVRDSLAKHLCASLGRPAPMIPCSAFLAAGDRIGRVKGNGTILINYMSGGGHYEWNQEIDPRIWRKTVRELISRLRNRHSLAFICHNETEYHLARDLDPTISCLWPKTPHEYFTLASEAKVALCNRLHASVGLAGLGIPSIAVGTDTRLLMVKALNLPCFYVKEASVEKLEDRLEDLVNHHDEVKENLLSLKSETWRSYVETIADAIQ